MLKKKKQKKHLCTDVCNGSLSLFNWIVID